MHSGIPLSRLAWRNLWRHPRRTVITLSSIAFGTFFALIFTGIGDSNWAEMINLAARLGGGHVTLQHPEYLDSPTLSRTVRGVGLVEAARREPDVTRVVTRITGQLMLSTADSSYGAAFIAFDPSGEDLSTLSLLEAVTEGEPFRGASERGIIIGQRLARNLGAPLGRKVVFMLTDKHGEIVRDVSRVSGILKTGAPSVDGALVLLPIDRMREVLGYETEEVSQVAVFLGDQRNADRVASRLERSIGPRAAALTWSQTHPDLAGFIAMKVAGAVFMEGVIMLLVAAGIFNTLFVSVMERVREFGILMAIGFEPGRLFRMVMFESLWLGLLGVVLGFAITAWPYWYLATTGIDVLALAGTSETPEIAGVAMADRMFAAIYPENAVLIALAAVGATLLAAVYPASRAGLIEPVDSIRLV